MTDSISLFIIFTLIVVIVIQAVDRYFSSQATQEQTQKLVAAVISKNMVDYTSAIKVEKEPAAKLQDADEVELSQADDAVFDKFIAGQNR